MNCEICDTIMSDEEVEDSYQRTSGMFLCLECLSESESETLFDPVDDLDSIFIEEMFDL